MARYRGTFTAAANYEPLKAAPFDARQLVETKTDLTNAATWKQLNGDIWTYIGMMVVVAKDIEPLNNGLYILTAADYTDIKNWKKYASDTDIAQLQEQIDNLEVGASLDVEVETEIELPAEGDGNTTYYIKENLSIQRWDEETQTYISYGGSGEPPAFDVNLIYGGDSNGNN